MPLNGIRNGWPILTHRAVRSDVQCCAINDRNGTCGRGSMESFFQVGPDIVQWSLRAITPAGPYRLEIQFPGVPMIETYTALTGALLRIAEMEEVLAPTPEGLPA